MTHLARAYRDGGRLDQAVKLFEKVLEVRQAKLGPDHRDTLLSMVHLANALQQRGDFDRAERLLRQCLAVRRRKEPDAWTTSQTQSLLGGCLLRQKRYADAEPLLLAGYAGLNRHEKAIPARDKARLSEALERLVRLYDAWGKPEQAAAWRKQLGRANPPAK
jgi:tetratricopeptide (TPR) repeat protein